MNKNIPLHQNMANAWSRKSPKSFAIGDIVSVTNSPIAWEVSAKVKKDRYDLVGTGKDSNMVKINIGVQHMDLV